MLEPIDNYCERIDTSWFGEPLGLTSNIAFLIAALLIWRFAAALPAGPLRRQMRTLACLAGAIGCGSGIFHAHPNILTMAADVIPIALFAFYFLFSYFSWLKASSRSIRGHVLSVGALIAIPALLVRLTGTSHVLAGGEAYLGLITGMLWLGSQDANRSRGRYLFVTGLIFFAALSARTIDQYICASWPSGTHFIWHLINAWVIFRLARTLSLSQGAA